MKEGAMLWIFTQLHHSTYFLISLSAYTYAYIPLEYMNSHGILQAYTVVHEHIWIGWMVILPKLKHQLECVLIKSTIVLHLQLIQFICFEHLRPH